MSKFFSISLEITYVLIGILVAIQIENYSQQKKFQNYYSSIILNLQDDLKSDLEECDLNLKINTKHVSIIDSFLNIEPFQVNLIELQKACRTTILLNKVNDKNEVIEMAPDECPNPMIRNKLIQLVKTKYTHIKGVENYTVLRGIRLEQEITKNISQNKMTNQLSFLCSNFSSKLKYLCEIYKKTIDEIRNLTALLEREN